MKERVTITLDSDILKKLDSKVDGFEIKNRSHAIEMLISKSFQSDIPSIALIMAAGEDKKVISNGKKVSLKSAMIKNRTVIEHVISLFRKYGVKDIYLAVCYNKEEIINYFGNGERFGIRINYIEEEKPSGTTNLIRKIKPYIKGPFFVSNADELKDMNLDEMYSFHKSNKSIATIALTTVQDPNVYGVVNVEGNKIRSFTEKPKDRNGASMIINSGLYLFNQEIIDMIPENSKMLYDFLPELATDGKLYGYLFTGQWFDISDQKKFDLASKNWINID